MWWLFAALALIAVLMAVNNRRGGAWSRRLDAALVAAWLLNLVAVVWAMGWRGGLMGVALSIAAEVPAMKLSAGLSPE